MCGVWLDVELRSEPRCAGVCTSAWRVDSVCQVHRVYCDPVLGAVRTLAWCEVMFCDVHNSCCDSPRIARRTHTPTHSHMITDGAVRFEGESKYEFFRFTMDSLEPRSSDLWISVGFAWLFNLYVLYLINNEWKNYVVIRQEFLELGDEDADGGEQV